MPTKHTGLVPRRHFLKLVVASAFLLGRGKAFARERDDLSSDQFCRLLMERVALSFSGAQIGVVKWYPDTLSAHVVDVGMQIPSAAALDDLARHPVPRGTRLLGITDTDLSYPGRTFVFGEADEKRRVAVISLHRLRGSSPNEALLYQRVFKEASHELGHTYGLGHCVDWRCAMHFSSSVGELDVRGSAFCSSHTHELRHALRND